MFLKMVVNQARRKWVVTCLLFLAMASLVVLYVYLGNSIRFTNRAMQIIMKNMGHNLLMIPERANPLDTYRCSQHQVLFPDATTKELAKHGYLNSRYYVSVLQTMTGVEGHEFVLTGIEPVKSPGETREKANPVTPIDAGCCRLGAAVAAALGAGPGDTVKVTGADFRIDAVFPEKGSMDDFRIYVPLAECQKLLGAEGRINLILAFECLHGGGSLADIAERQRRNLARVVPGIIQISKSDIAKGRFMARLTTQRYLYYLLGIVLCITVVVIAGTGLQEVSERRQETGIMVSMGTGHTYIIGLYLAKILAVALAASASGFLIGSWLSVWLTRPFLVFSTKPVTIIWQQLPGVILLACAVAVIAEIIPMIKLVRTDPSTILMEE